MRNRLAVIFSAAAFAIVFAAAGASAQDRAGGWFGVGAGWGSADLKSDEIGDSGDRENSGVVYFNGGYTINPHVQAGGEFNLWTKTFEDAGLGGDMDVNFYNLLGTVTVYPSVGVGGFFLKGGAGVGFFDMKAKAAGVTVNFDMGRGLAVIGGGGYDIPAGRLMITPAVNYWYGQTGDMKVLGETLFTNVSHNTITATVGVKWP